MIAAISPLHSATTVHAANPTRKHRSCEALCCSSDLGFRSSERRRWVNPTRMELLNRIIGGGGCFRDPGRREIKVEIDSGGEDVFASHPKGGAVPEHLVIMVNGIIGRFAFPIIICGLIKCTGFFFPVYLVICVKL